MQRTIQPLGWAFLTALFCVLLGSGCGKEQAQSQQQGQGMPPLAVRVGKAEQKDVPYYIDTIGNTRAYRSVRIVPQVSGQIEEVHFDQGQEVKTGDLLYTLDERPFRAQVEQAKAQLELAKAQLKLNELELERNQKLAEQEFISKQSLDSLKTNVSVAKARIQEAEGALLNARTNLDYATIEAPVDGITGPYLVDKGNIVSAGVQELMLLQEIDPLYVDFIVPEDRLLDVQKYLRQSGGKLSCKVSPMGDKDVKARQGTIFLVDNQVQRETGTVLLRARLPNDAKDYWPGMSVNVRIILDTLKDAILVPKESVRLSPQGTFVFIVGKDNSVSFQPVETGQDIDGHTIIKKGVEAGDTVVADGLRMMMITPGAKVQPVQPGQPMPHQAGQPPGAAGSGQPGADGQQSAPSAAQQSSGNSSGNKQ